MTSDAGLRRIPYRFDSVRRGLDFLEAADLGDWLRDRAPELGSRIREAFADLTWEGELVFSTDDLDAIAAELQQHEIAERPGLRELANLIEERKLS